MSVWWIIFFPTLFACWSQYIWLQLWQILSVLQVSMDDEKHHSFQHSRQPGVAFLYSSISCLLVVCWHWRCTWKIDTRNMFDCILWACPACISGITICILVCLSNVIFLGLWVSLAFLHEPEWNVDGFIVQAVERAAGPEGQRITYNIIKQRLSDVIYKLV